MGDMLCVAVKVGMLFGVEVKGYMDVGKFVLDVLIIGFVKECLKEFDCVNGYLFDGFLCMIVQVDVMKEVGVVIDYVFEIDVLFLEIIECMSGCCMYLVLGCMYYVKFNLLKVEGYDDVMGELLIQCDDDKEEIVKKCFEVYEVQIKLLIMYYGDWVQCGEENGLKVLQYCKILGFGIVDEICECVFDVLK